MVKAARLLSSKKVPSLWGGTFFAYYKYKCDSQDLRHERIDTNLNAIKRGDCHFGSHLFVFSAPEEQF